MSTNISCDSFLLFPLHVRYRLFTLIYNLFCYLNVPESCHNFSSLSKNVFGHENESITDRVYCNNDMSTSCLS
jgi:hypothetical protein